MFAYINTQKNITRIFVTHYNFSTWNGESVFVKLFMCWPFIRLNSSNNSIERCELINVGNVYIIHSNIPTDTHSMLMKT